LRGPPAWWDRPPDLTAEVKETLLSLSDWAAGRLDQKPDVVDTLLSVVRDPSKDEKDRVLGLWFLAALDEAAHLVEFLGDQDGETAAIRTTACCACMTGCAATAR
jgi:hypothetical protein